MAVPFLDLKAQYASIKGEIDEAVMKALAGCQFIMGPNVAAFEKELAEFLGAAHVVTCASGSDALLLALMALGVGRGDEVITTPFTFFATCGAIARLGATPVFCDIDPATYNIDHRRIETHVTEYTKAILPVHLYGLPADMGKISAVASAAGVPVVEDCAQSLGASLSGRMTATIGAMGCVSFFPSKNLGCAGDGGAVVTGDAALAEKLGMLRVHGAKPKYFHKYVGINSRLDDVQAAILRVKLRRLSEWNRRRRQIAETYDGLLAQAGIAAPQTAEGSGHIYHQYVVRVKNRDAVMDFMKKKEIQTGIYYPLAMHMQECFAYLEYSKGDFPESEKACEEILSLPIYPEMTREMVEEVVSALDAANRKFNGTARAATVK